MKLFFYTLSAAVLLTACNSGLGNHQRTTSAVTPAPFKAPPPITAFPKAEAATASVATPDSNNNSIVVNPQTVNVASIAAVQPKLNPTHGQPGHRCDIAVGQPLNSAPAKPAAATPVVSKPTTTSTTPVANIPPDATTGVKLNPKHGQPGHRCDISVGQPLNNAPAQSTPAITPAPEAAVTPAAATTTPSLVVTAPASVATNTANGNNPFSKNNFFPAKPAATNGVKLNPKHGEPGHRCGVAVGHPLN